MVEQNKGEWSEFYVFLKLLGDGILYAADADLEKIEDVYYNLVSVIRCENNRKIKYYRDNDIRIFDENGTELDCLFTINDFRTKAEVLLNTIKRTSKTTFGIPEIENFMQKIHCTKVKADSKDKSDINLELHDRKYPSLQEFGFSIKSKLGSPPTLLNAAHATNFIYEIQGNISKQQIEEINAIDTSSKLKDRINKLFHFNCRLKYVRVENTYFQYNLEMIDTMFPQIMAQCLLQYYQGSSSLISQLTQYVLNESPEQITFCQYKMKLFLTAIALGMVPSKLWNGSYSATGGYIIVRSDGEILCYHCYNHNEFQEYLFKNTKFETPSTKRHGFGLVYSENNKNYFKLNLQIRFID